MIPRTKYLKSAARLTLALMATIVFAGCITDPSTPTRPPVTPQPPTAQATIGATPSQPPSSPQTSPATPTSQPTLNPTDQPTAPPSPSANPTFVPSPASPGASPAADCVNGWMAPAPGSAEYGAALEMIESQMGVAGPWTVDEMRYFTGPDVPWILEPHYDTVLYWYVRAALVDDATFAGRWLLEQRTDTIRGISAVAPASTVGYGSPDWTGFTGEGKARVHAGLPGKWGGIPYDFVTGEGDSGMPGLPDQVVGCLAGT